MLHCKHKKRTTEYFTEINNQAKKLPVGFSIDTLMHSLFGQKT